MNLLDDMSCYLWSTKNVVYCYTNLINNKKYIGQTSRTLKNRHCEHIYSSNKSTYIDYNLPIHNSIRKYGIENFKLEILHFAQSNEELNYFETFYIKSNNTLCKKDGYNIQKGGKHSSWLDGLNERQKNEKIEKIWTEERRTNLKEKMKKQYKMGEHPFAKMSFNGENNPFYGKHHDDLMKKHLSKQKKGTKNIKSKQICQYDLNGNLLKVWNYMRQIEEETNMKHGGISLCCNGKREQAYGYQWRIVENNTIIKKIQPLKMRKIIQYDMNDKPIKIWNTIQDISDSLGIDKSRLYSCCNGKQKTTSGFKWKYVDFNMATLSEVDMETIETCND